VLAWGIGVAVVSLGLIIPLALPMTDDETKSTTRTTLSRSNTVSWRSIRWTAISRQKLPGQIGIGGFGLPPSLVAGEGALWTTALSGPDPSGPLER
jgi:hypothetical protein